MAATVHGALVATFVGRWRGLLLRGPSGAGKSDFVLRCLDTGWALVADDRVVLWASQGRLFGRAPQPLRGLVELRGQGMARCASLGFCAVEAVADLAATAERQPLPATETLCGVALPRHVLAPLEASAPARLRRIVEGLDHGL